MPMGTTDEMCGTDANGGKTIIIIIETENEYALCFELCGSIDTYSLHSLFIAF
jgi:hypothetical protein